MGLLQRCRTSLPHKQACTQLSNPACGCNNVTYGNPCQASAAGESVLSLGQCGALSSSMDACSRNADCAADRYCQFPDGQCQGQGTCVGMPQVQREKEKNRNPQLITRVELGRSVRKNCRRCVGVMVVPMATDALRKPTAFRSCPALPLAKTWRFHRVPK
jgi:hypothetical protein